MPICSHAPGRNINLSGIVYTKDKKMYGIAIANHMPHNNTIEYQQLEQQHAKSCGEISLIPILYHDEVKLSFK